MSKLIAGDLYVVTGCNSVIAYSDPDDYEKCFIIDKNETVIILNDLYYHNLIDSGFKVFPDTESTKHYMKNLFIKGIVSNKIGYIPYKYLTNIT